MFGKCGAKSTHVKWQRIYNKKTGKASKVKYTVTVKCTKEKGHKGSHSWGGGR